MTDPYSFLGVSRSADETEIKKAYRALSKKYHPDNNPGNPAAEEKFKQIQSAYEQIMEERRNGGPSYGTGGYGQNSYRQQTGSYGNQTQYDDLFEFFGFGGFGGFTGSARQNGPTVSPEERDLQSAGVYLNNGYYREAINVLNSMSERGHRWYYYSAVANLGIGNNITALEHAKKALELDPGNYEYAALVDRIENGTARYDRAREYYDLRPRRNGSICLKMMLGYMVCSVFTLGGNAICGNMSGYGPGFCCGPGYYY